MKLFEIQPDAKIVEPPIKGNDLPVVYLGQKYLALLTGGEMPKGTRGLKNVDWENDDTIRKDAAAQLTAVAKIGSMGKAELSVYRALTAPSVEDQQRAFVGKVREEVARRILSHASQATQMNLAAAAAGGILDEDQMTAYRAGLGWVAQVRKAGTTLAANGDQDFADDAKWPDVPADAAELAAQF